MIADDIRGETRTDEITLRRWKAERDAAIAWVQLLQESGVVAKEDWLKFSEKIRIAAERVLAESEVNGPTSDLLSFKFGGIDR